MLMGTNLPMGLVCGCGIEPNELGVELARMGAGLVDGMGQLG